MGCFVLTSIVSSTQGAACGDGGGGGALACVDRARGRGRHCLCAPDVSQTVIEPRPPSRCGAEWSISRRELGEQRSWRRWWRRWCRRRWRWVQQPGEHDRGRREHLRLVRRPSEARQVTLSRVLNGRGAPLLSTQQPQPPISTTNFLF